MTAGAGRESVPAGCRVGTLRGNRRAGIPAPFRCRACAPWGRVGARSGAAAGWRSRGGRLKLIEAKKQFERPLCTSAATAGDPLLPADLFMGNVGLPITKLTYTVTWAPAAARPLLPLAPFNFDGRSESVQDVGPTQTKPPRVSDFEVVEATFSRADRSEIRLALDVP